MTRRSAIPLAMAILLAGVPTLASDPAAAGSGTPTFAIHRGPAALDNAGEPTLGINWATGAVMFQDYADTWRVTFDENGAATWTNVRPPNSIVNVDPILFTDSLAGRTFAGGLDGSCSILSYSDDDGASWTPMGNPCAATFDHQTIGSGPWKQGQRPATATYDRAVYYCAQLAAVQCALSQDGGLTFGAGAPVNCQGDTPGLHGSVHVGNNGYVWLPFKNSAGHVCVARSMDHGLTWTGFRLSPTPRDGFDPDVATTTDNWVYVGHPDEKLKPRVSLSKDNGATWTRSPDLGAAFGIVNTSFYEMVAGDNERAALAFLGTSTPGNAFQCTFTGDWHLYVAFTYDAGATWATQRLTSDPVQRGGIWDKGGSSPCRNLLDFMDAQVDPEGNVYVGFADGCVDACAAPGGTPAMSNRDWGTIARQVAGRGLFAAYDDGLAATPPGAPALSGSAAGSTVSLAWTTPADGGSAIRGYNLYRDGALLVDLGIVNAYTDANAQDGVTYTYEVSAWNAAGEGAHSNGVTITPRASTAPPSPCFTFVTNDLTVEVDGSCSTDADGHVAGWTWSWGDGSADSAGVTATHAFPIGGTYTVTLTAMDDNGATASTSQQVTVAETGGDPDPSSPTIGHDQTVTTQNGPKNTWQYWKIRVPEGATVLDVTTDGPDCQIACVNHPNVDLYLLHGGKPSETSFACRSITAESDERCVLNAPASGWWWIGVHSKNGDRGATIELKARHT